MKPTAISNWKKSLERKKIKDDVLDFVNINIANKPFPVIIDSSGNPIPFFPIDFSKHFTLTTPNTTTSITSLGNSVTSVGTLSHPTATKKYSYMTMFKSAATAAATAGSGNNAVMWLTGDNPDNIGEGFLFYAKLAFPNASYNTTGAGIGSRIFIGFTSGTMAASVANNDPTGHHLGFQRISEHDGVQDTTWKFVSKDGTTLNISDTLLTFNPESIYEFYIYHVAGSGVVYGYIKDITSDVVASGQVSSNLPGATTLLRGGFQIQTIDAVARDIMLQRLFISSLK